MLSSTLRLPREELKIFLCYFLEMNQSFMEIALYEEV